MPTEGDDMPLLMTMSARELDEVFAMGIGSMTPVYNNMKAEADRLAQSIHDDHEMELSASMTGG